ncbi:phosphoglycerate mutase [Rhodoferax ferrireducens]|uniref:phosphoglycerate mutase n=1 Tax=Rhodoferax ferrireducens TaxID=192843 RepID=UPI000E0D674A|nr:phosphoglycerate mutase [Rhodoferax ferrireducens]
MHLLIPFAYCTSEGCAAALPTLKLPHLEKLLARLTPEPPDVGDEFSLSPPHERALARTLGLPVTDGLIPWAALQDRSSESGWGFITPCHWQIGTNHIAMSGQELPDFPAQESQALLAAMQPYFEEDGITLQYDQPSRWLASGEVFRELATASLDRVVGRNLENWMPRSASAAHLRRLQNEMQMLLYTHPVNDARAARGALPVNSFWLSGTGALPQTRQKPVSEPPPLVLTPLRDAALNEDWAAWAQAWATLDATECAALLAALEQGEPGQLTLCGERHAQTFYPRTQTFVKRFMNIFGTQPPSTVLEKL